MHHLYKATAAFILLAGGCGSSADLDAVLGQQANPAPPPVTTTNLFVQGPAVTGQVAVQTVEGEVLAQGAATAGIASFTLPADLVSGEPSPLVVTFTADSGEHLEAGSGPATFRAVVPNPVADDVVGIDAVSSMIATHHLNHEGLSFEGAARDVFTYLALPPETDPEHLFEDTPFESSLFYEADP